VFLMLDGVVPKLQTCMIFTFLETNMTDPNRISTLPHMPGLAWRPLQPTDQAAITALSAACQAADGGQALIAANAYIQAPDADTPPRTTIGAFDPDGNLAACAAVGLEQAPQEQRANILGQVHPNPRGRGIGAFLLSWSIAQARVLLSATPSDRPRVLRLTTEALTPAGSTSGSASHSSSLKMSCGATCAWRCRMRHSRPA
jgi:GNAT superfamily N-acetyltransferase